MRLTNKIIEETIIEVVGEEALSIIEFLKNRKNISEFIIAEKTDTEIHVVRNILYKLQHANLATYKRKKDSKKGYYISYWTFNQKKIKDVIRELKKSKLEKLKERLKREEENQNGFFICPNACVRLDFEQATEHNFKCPECGALLIQQDNTRTIMNLKERIKEIESSA